MKPTGGVDQMFGEMTWGFEDMDCEGILDISTPQSFIMFFS